MMPGMLTNDRQSITRRKGGFMQLGEFSSYITTNSCIENGRGSRDWTSVFGSSSASNLPKCHPVKNTANIELGPKPAK
jgi:hypothetical protein